MSIDNQLRSVCQDRCGEMGDPACYEIDDRSDIPWTPCSECLAELGLPIPPQPQDPNAAIRNLI